mgnify:CR=1 FL=1
MKSFIKNIISSILAIIASVIIFISLLIGVISLIGSEETTTIKKNSILKIDLTNTSVVERASENPFDALNLSGEVQETIEIKQILDNIEKAKRDKNILAIYINTSYVNAGLSQTEEIRNKLLEFKATGKPIIAYSEVYSQLAYYLASIANNIYLNPQGIIDLKGLSVGIMFYKGLLEKLDVDMQIIRHGKFKSAIEPFSLEKMSESNREQMTLFLNSIANNIMDSMAHQRGLTLSEVNNHANKLTLENAKSCLQLNYVDSLLYQDQVEKMLITVSKAEKFISSSKKN